MFRFYTVNPAFLNTWSFHFRRVIQMPSHPKRPFLTVGLPFLAFMVLGHRALTYIGQGRYDVSSYKFSEFTTFSILSSFPNANKIPTATFAEIQ